MNYEKHLQKIRSKIFEYPENTQEKHRQNLMDKFDLRNTAAITRYAIAHHLIKLEECA